MKKNLSSIGGQFWNDNNIFQVSEEKKINNQIIFDGASSTIRFIIKNLNLNDEEYVLLPSYLCPTIVANFNKFNINIDFYKIDKDLKIDMNDLNEKLLMYKTKAVYIINYFGRGFNEKEKKYLQSIKDREYLIIEDAVQSFWIFEYKNSIGDYVFNSLRKFIPVDGSVLLTSEKININNYNIKNLHINSEYMELINYAREEKKNYINGTIKYEEDFLKNFKKSENIYEKNKNISILLEEQIRKISIINSDYISKKRRENFQYVYSELIKNKNIKFITDIEILNNKVIPLALVILLNDRDSIRKKLSEQRIFCPIHWNLRNEQFAEKFNDSIYISEKILSIPIDQRYSKEQYETLIKILKEV